MSSPTKSTSSISPTTRGCIVFVWLVAFAFGVALGYSVAGVGGAVFAAVVLGIALLLAVRDSRRRPDGGVSLPPRPDTHLPAGWASAGARFTGGGSSGSW